MADKRLVSKSIVRTDIFKSMSKSAQLLYYDLLLEADDDGFVGNPKGVARFCEASAKDIQELLDKRYLLGWESGVVVIKHWHIHNKIRSDRYHETNYQKEYETLGFDEWGAYTELEKNVDTELHTNCQPNGNQMETQVKLSKDKISYLKESKREKFAPPKIEEVADFIKTNNYKVDAQRFIDYYESNGWKVGKNQMKDWKAAVRTWNSREKTEQQKTTSYDVEKVKMRAQQPIVYERK